MYCYRNGIITVTFLPSTVLIIIFWLVDDDHGVLG
jgi:hypothetical protein